VNVWIVVLAAACTLGDAMEAVRGECQSRRTCFTVIIRTGAGPAIAGCAARPMPEPALTRIATVVAFKSRDTSASLEEVLADRS
jgi:hypothetical protein